MNKLMLRIRRWGLTVCCCASLLACGDDGGVTVLVAADEGTRLDAGDTGDLGTPDATDIGPEPPLILTGPLLTMGPNPNAPLAGVLELSTDRATRVEVTLEWEGNVDELAFDELDSEHELTLLGVHPETRYDVIVAVVDEEGLRTEASTALEIEPIDLPADFPELLVVTSMPARMEPGVTLFNVPRLDNTAGGFLVAVDAEGRVVWLLDHADRPTDARQLDNGHLLFLQGDRRLALEMDLLGNVVASWHPSGSTADGSSIAVETESMHHEIVALPTGGFATLGSELRFLDDYPSSDVDPTPRTEPVAVIGDVLVAFARDGTLIDSLSLFDVLDPYRIAYDSFGGFWNDHYIDEAEATLDWSHGNALVYDERDDTYIVSLRHQDAVVKLDREGGLVWILGPHDNWSEAFEPYLLTPVGDDFGWQYHQHAPAITPTGTLLLFDNGVGRASPPDPQLEEASRYSRAVELEIDEERMEVSQVWQYGEDLAEPIHSRIVGDADWQPETSNVLITFGGLGPQDEGLPSARIIEVTHSLPAEIVFEIDVSDDNPDGPAARTVYRSERLPGLYR